MFNLSGSELVFLVLIALVVLGPDKLPEAMRKAGKAYADFKKMTSGFQSEMRSVLDEPMRELRETAELAKKAASWDTNMLDTKPVSASMADHTPGPAATSPAVEDPAAEDATSRRLQGAAPPTAVVASGQMTGFTPAPAEAPVEPVVEPAAPPHSPNFTSAAPRIPSPVVQPSADGASDVAADADEVAAE